MMEGNDLTKPNAPTLQNAWIRTSFDSVTLKELGEQIVNFDEEETTGEDPWTKLGTGQVPVKGLWIVSGFNPVKMTMDMESKIGGTGGQEKLSKSI